MKDQPNYPIDVFASQSKVEHKDDTVKIVLLVSDCEISRLHVTAKKRNRFESFDNKVT
jgi:hypothetical protein